MITINHPKLSFHHTSFPSSHARTRVLSQSKWSFRGSKDWRSVGGGGVGVDGVGSEGGAGGESGAGDGGVGDGGGGGVGGAVPSTLREEKVATFCLAVVVTLRLPEAGGGEGWIRRGRAGGGGLEGAAATEVVEEAKVAWCRAALTLAFSFFAGPR